MNPLGPTSHQLYQGVWSLQSCGDGVNLAELSILAGGRPSKLCNSRTELQGHRKSLELINGISEDFGVGYMVTVGVERRKPADW